MRPRKRPLPLVKAKEITRDQVLAAVATIFDGKTALPVSDG